MLVKIRVLVFFMVAPITRSIPMPPGPTVMGMAKGTTANSFKHSSFVFVPSLLPFTSSTPDKNSKAPAPILKASKVMPKR